MAKFDRKEYKQLKRWAKANGVCTYALDLTEADDPHYNGISVAYKAANDNSDCRMVHVAVSYCAPEDEFKNKKGKREALIKFMSGETIQLPIADFLRDNGPKSDTVKTFIAYDIFRV